MLAVPMNDGVQPRLVPPAFVEDNINEVFDAVDAGRAEGTVTAVDRYGNRTAIPTPDGVNHDTLGRPLEFSSHPVLAKNVRRRLIRMLRGQYCRDHAWNDAESGDWVTCVGLPDDLGATVSEEHMASLKPVLNTPAADPYRLVARYNARRYSPCTLDVLIRLAYQAAPNYSTNWRQADSKRRFAVPPIPKRNRDGWDGMNRVRDRWSGCEWVYPALEYFDPVRLLLRESRQGGLPESFQYPLRTSKGEFRLEKGCMTPRALILLDGKPVGVMISEDCDEPFTDIPPEWCAVPLPDGATGTAVDELLPDGDFKPSFQQALLDFAERF